MRTTTDARLGRIVRPEDIARAAERIQGAIVRTPLVADDRLSELLEADVRLKVESLQKSGSFKARGACNFLARLSDEEIGAGVITFSSGNHGQALAFAARLRGVPAVVVMPKTAPRVKVDGAKRLGARVEFAGSTSEERRDRALWIARREGLRIVPPFDHPWIIEGQGTIAAEVIEEWPEVDLIATPIGGGGQAAGCAAMASGKDSGVEVVGVEPKGAASMRAALDAGEPRTLPETETIADGLAPVRAGELTHRHLRLLGTSVVLVDDAEIRRATRHLMVHCKLVAEYSGAATTAALMSGSIPAKGRRVCAVLSGGNLDPSLLSEIANAR